jgi:multiple sugar transport system permease protein
MQNKRKFSPQTLAGILFLLPNLIGFFIFTLLPLILSLILSFFKCDLLQTQNILSWDFVGFKNFTTLLGFYNDGAGIKANDPEFWRFLWNTLFLMIKIPISIVFSLVLALILNKQIKGKTLFRTIYFLPTICTGTALFMMWRWIFNSDFGMINLFLDKLSLGRIIGPKWLSDIYWAKPSFILMNIWTDMGGINMLLYLAALQSIPQEYTEAAALDGASRWERFRNITWPMLGPTTFFIIIINLINGFQEGFQQAHIMTQGGPAGSTTVLGYYIYNQAYVWNHMGYASAISWILFLIILAITIASWKFGNKTVYYK